MARNVREPKNETYLAAELSSVMPAPGRAALLAVQLCAMGREYKRIAEKLCGAEEVWGEWSPKVEKAQARALKRRQSLVLGCAQLLTGIPAKVEEGDLLLLCHTRMKRSERGVQDTYITALL